MGEGRPALTLLWAPSMALPCALLPTGVQAGKWAPLRNLLRWSWDGVGPTTPGVLCWGNPMVEVPWRRWAGMAGD